MICKQCKNNLNNRCVVFKCKIITLPYWKKDCSKFKKRLAKPIRNVIKKESLKQEKKFIAKLNDKLVKATPASGSTATSKGDATIVGKFMLESKATKNNKITIRENWLEQLDRNSIKFGKIPILSVEFIKKNKQYYILSEDDFIELISQYLNKK